jgi:hypothetical protein
MLKRIANIFTGSVAHGAGTIIGVRAGHDAYNWAKDGGAKRTVKRIAGTMADAANSLADATNTVLLQKEAPALRSVPESSSADDEAAAANVRSAQHRVSVAELVQVDCERCRRPAAVQLGSGDVIVTCAKCTARFWVDTDELAQRRNLK